MPPRKKMQMRVSPGAALTIWGERKASCCGVQWGKRARLTPSVPKFVKRSRLFTVYFLSLAARGAVLGEILSSGDVPSNVKLTWIKRLYPFRLNTL